MLTIQFLSRRRELAMRHINPSHGTTPCNRCGWLQGMRLTLLALAAVAVLMPAMADAQAPRVVRSLEDLRLTPDSGPHRVDLRGVYWGAPDECIAESMDESVATVFIEDGYDLWVTPVGGGETSISLKAVNEYGSVEHGFNVSVKHVPPVAVGAFPEAEIRVGDVMTLDMAAGFYGEAITYSAISSDEGAATVSVSGTTATITGLKAGMAKITVTATNSGGSAEQSFALWVLDVPPAPVGQLPDITMTVGDDPVSMEIASAFSGTELNFSAMSAADGMATVSIEGTTITVSAIAAGMAAITVTATNSAGSAEQSFVVTVLDVPPEASATLPDIQLVTGGEAAMVDAAAYFSGTALVFSASGSGEAISVTRYGSHVSVAPLIEGTGTVTVTATNSAGAASQTFTATVSTDVAESDALENTLAAIGRNTLASAVSALGARFQGERLGGSATGASSFSNGYANRFGANSPYGGGIGGAYPAGSPQGPGCCAASLAASPNGFGGVAAVPYGTEAFGRSGGLRQLGGMSFAMPLNAAGNGAVWTPAAQWTLWGQVDHQSFEGAGYDGSLTSLYLGADANFGDKWLAGVALSHSSADADYKFDSAMASGTGDLDTSLVSVIPYVHWTLDELAEVWAFGGAGWGDIDHDRSVTAQEGDADLSMWMLAAGGRRTLASGAEWGFALVGDAGILEMQTDGGTGIIDDMNVSVGRVKLAFEGERIIVAENGNTFAVFGQVGGRHDSGDGDTGSGVELTGGIRSDTAGRVRLEAKARLLSLHSAESYEENGVSVSAMIRPRADGSGMSLALSSYFGAGMHATQRPLEQGYGYPGRIDEMGDALDAWGMDARLGYTFRAPRLSGLLTPFASFDMAGDAGRGMRMGLRYDLANSGSGTLLNLEFTGGQEYDRWRREAHNMVQLRGELRF